jgi:hypothetical protein
MPSRLQQLEQSGKPLSEFGPETARLNKVAGNIIENQKDKASPGLSDTIEGSFIRAAQTWDLNHDGEVTCEEWRSYAASLFKEADSDHDGKLTREEFAKLPKIDRLFEVANFDYYDVNKQGYVTQADFVDRPNPAFAALDHDKSCVINLYWLPSIEEASGGCLNCTSGRGQGEEEGSGGSHSDSSGSHSSSGHSSSGYSSSGYSSSSSGYSSSHSGSSSSSSSSSSSHSGSSSKSNCPNSSGKGCN